MTYVSYARTGETDIDEEARKEAIFQQMLNDPDEFKGVLEEFIEDDDLVFQLYGMILSLVVEVQEKEFKEMEVPHALGNFFGAQLLAIMVRKSDEAIENQVVVS